jgi:hypothetical protein
LPADARFVTDPVTAAQLRFLLPARRERIASYTSGASGADGGPLFVLSDPLRLAAEREQGRVPPGPMTTPPSSWKPVAHFARQPRTSLRGGLRRLLGGGPAPTAETDGATLWRAGQGWAAR